MTSGFINLHKPATWSSHDCVARIRRLLNTKKVGHSGTLDPLATGVLPIAVGRATRLIQYLPNRKAYRAVIRFGMTTTTDDLEGEILTQQSATDLSRPSVEAALTAFIGNIRQVPPMYSAIQVDGQRLYDLARKGKRIDVPVREVTIHQLVSQGWSPQLQSNPQPDQLPELTLDIDCGPGTYIRSLARDLGAAVGTGATLAQLIRTHSNGFDLASSITLEALEQALNEETFMPLAAGKAMAHLDEIALSPALALRWRMGQKLALAQTGVEAGISGKGVRCASASAPTHPTSPPLRVLDATTGNFLGIGEIRWVPPSLSSPETATKLSPILAAKRVFLAVD